MASGKTMTETVTKAINRLIWDYQVSADEFMSMLDGEIKPGGFDRLWALGRAVEGMNYYDLLEIAGLERIKRDWSSLKPTLRNKTRIKGIEYFLLKWNQLPLV